MEILTVSNDKALLADLHGALRSLFPTAYIAQETDPLMAGKYAFQNDVDRLWTVAVAKTRISMSFAR